MTTSNPLQQPVDDPRCQSELPKCSARWISFVLSAALLSVFCVACDDSTTSSEPPADSPDAAGEAGADAGPDADDAAADAAADATEEAAAPDAEAGVDSATDAGGEGGTPGSCTWEVDLVDDQPAFKARAAAAVGTDGIPQLAYNVATSADGWDTPAVWHAKLVSGSWQRTLAADTAGRSNEYPVIALGTANHATLLYNRYIQAADQIDVFHIDDLGGASFTAPASATGDSASDEYAPTVASDGQGRLHVAFQVRDAKPGQPGEYDYRIGYVLVDGGQPSTVESIADGSAMFSLSPDYDIAADAAGDAHAVYCRPGSNQLNNVLYYRRRTAGTWGQEERLSELDMDVWGPSIAVDAAGTVHVAYTYGPDWSNKTLTYDRKAGGTWAGAQALTTSTEDRSYYLGLAAAADGTVHIGFHRFFNSNGDILYLQGKDGVFLPEERLTTTPDGDEGDPGIVLGPLGEAYLSFVENLQDAPNGKVYLGKRVCTETTSN